MFGMEDLRGWALESVSNEPRGLLKLHFFRFEVLEAGLDQTMRRAQLLAVAPERVDFRAFGLKEGRSPICTDIQVTRDDALFSIIVRLEVGEVQIDGARKLDVFRY